MIEPHKQAPRDVYVACYADVLGWGGGVSAASGVADACAERGLSTLLLGIGSQSAAIDHAGQTANRMNISLPVTRLLWRVRSWRTSGRLARKLRELPAPRVAFVGVSSFWVVAARLAWPDVPVVYLFPCLLQNCLPFTWPQRRPTDSWAMIDYTGVCRSERTAFKESHRVIVATEQGRQEVLAAHPDAGDKITVCYFGCKSYDSPPELRARLRRNLSLPDDGFVALAAGLFDHNKAFDHAVRELTASSAQVHLLLVGGGAQRTALENLARRMRVADRVHFTGPQQDMTPYYAAADCVISTSFYDTLPNVILDGMRAGLPALVPEHLPPEVYSGCAEVVEFEGAGLLYDRLAPGALASCLKRLADNPELAQACGRAGRDAAIRLFRWSGIAEAALANLSPASPAAAACSG